MREIDTSELDRLARDFMAAPARVIPALVPVANRAGINIKRAMRADATGHRGMPDLPRTIAYDVELTPTSVSVDVGWLEPTGQGHLENIAAFGTSKTPPLMDITRGLTDEVPNFMRWVAKVGSEAL